MAADDRALVDVDASRLRAAMPVAVDALRRLVVDIGLTDRELHVVLRYLGNVAQANELVLLCDVLGISRVVDDQTHAASSGTPSAVLGPFYVPDSPWTDNPGSIVRGPDDPTLVLTGFVRDALSGDPLPGAVLDVWHADAAGTYSNESPDLPAWHLRGRQRTDASGAYRILTVEPRHYTVKDDGPVGILLAALDRHAWRPAHIHYLATAEGYEPLVTQIYLAGGPYLDDDAIDDVKDELIRRVDDDELTFDFALMPGAPASRTED